MLDTVPIISIIVFIPLVGVGALMLCRSRSAIQWAALAASMLSFLASLVPLFGFDATATGFQYVEQASWIPALGISYHLGIDGLSLFLINLTAFLTVAAVLVSWNRIESKIKLYFALFLILATGMLGVFAALDTFLFYLFWEATLIPMFLIIGIWGSANRRYAAIKFIIYTMGGSVFMLVGIIVMAFLNQSLGSGFSFDLTEWFTLTVPTTYQWWLFIAFFVAFAVKIPAFPFHTWLPDAHVEAPTAGSVILAGVLLKMGAYGILRFCFPLFPVAVAEFTPIIMALGIIGVIYGAFLAFAQTDLKKLVAYSSISHMGLIVVGVFAMNLAGIKGGIIHMVNHGLSTGALFILVGALYERKGTRDMNRMGGLASRMPVMATLFMIVLLSSIGFPGLNGFVGELLLLLGAFQFAWWIGALGATTMVLGAIYMLWMYQRVMFETEREPAEGTCHDFSPRENCVMIPIIILIFVIGLFPSWFMNRMDTSAQELLSGTPAQHEYYAMPDHREHGKAQGIPYDF